MLSSGHRVCPYVLCSQCLPPFFIHLCLLIQENHLWTYCLAHNLTLYAFSTIYHFSIYLNFLKTIKSLFLEFNLHESRTIPISAIHWIPSTYHIWGYCRFSKIFVKEKIGERKERWKDWREEKRRRVEAMRYMEVYYQGKKWRTRSQGQLIDFQTKKWIDHVTPIQKKVLQKLSTKYMD